METLEKHLGAVYVGVDWGNGSDETVTTIVLVTMKNGVPSLSFIKAPDIQAINIEAVARQLSAELKRPVVPMPSEDSRASERRRKLN